MHVRTWGDPTGIPVLLIHGVTGCASLWDDVARRLMTRGFYAIACDLLSHGASPRATEHTISEYATAITTWLDGQALAPLHIVGHSLGGSIAMEIAATRPDLLRRLVIEDQPPEANPAEDESIWNVWAAIWPRRFDSREAGVAYLKKQNRNLAWWGPSLTQLPDGSWGWSFETADVVKIMHAVHREVYWDRLAQIQAPTLIIRGELSTHLTPDVAARMARVIPDGRLATLPGVDHWTHRNPGPYEDLVASFLSE